MSELPQKAKENLVALYPPRPEHLVRRVANRAFFGRFLGENTGALIYRPSAALVRKRAND